MQRVGTVPDGSDEAPACPLPPPAAACRQPTPLPAPPQPAQPAPFGCPADNAVNELRKKGMAAANKKASRHAAEGLVGLAKGDAVAAVVEVRRRQGCAWAQAPLLANLDERHTGPCVQFAHVPILAPRAYPPAVLPACLPACLPADQQRNRFRGPQRTVPQPGGQRSGSGPGGDVPAPRQQQRAGGRSLEGGQAGRWQQVRAGQGGMHPDGGGSSGLRA